jgi:hypothetical protein
MRRWSLTIAAAIVATIGGVAVAANTVTICTEHRLAAAGEVVEYGACHKVNPGEIQAPEIPDPGQLPPPNPPALPDPGELPAIPEPTVPELPDPGQVPDPGPLPTIPDPGSVPDPTVPPVPPVELPPLP